MTNEDLNKHPLNCGNCKQMKTHIIEWQGKRRVSSGCKRGLIFNVPDRGWLVDGKASGVKSIPLPWKAALQCGEFQSMVGDYE